MGNKTNAGFLGEGGWRSQPTTFIRRSMNSTGSQIAVLGSTWYHVWAMKPLILFQVTGRTCVNIGSNTFGLSAAEYPAKMET